MASCKIEDNCNRLIEFGKKPNTPVFYVASATCGNQKLIFGTLENIGQKTQHLEKGSPALIIVGEVGGLKERFDWRQYLPLNNKRLLCLRVRKQSSELAKRLKFLGADIIEAPFVEVQSCLKGGFHFEHFKSILFSDMTAASFFMKALEKSHKDIRDFGGSDFFVLDNKAEDFLKTFGIKVKLNFSGHCHEVIKKKLLKIEEKTFLTFGPKKGRPGLLEFFNTEKREIIYTPIYESNCHFPKIDPPEFDGIIAPSSSSMDLLSHGPWKSLIGEIPIFVMGPKTAERSKELGAQRVLVSQYDNRDSLIQKINETYKDKNE
jgi:uroporphyrinogen III methyltransferase/synthase